MKNFTLFIVLAILVQAGYPQNRAGYLIDYYPAPGQHINMENIGTPQAAQKMTEQLSSLVSLGSFGGYVILKFEKACINDPQNPYGIDFTIFGNAFAGSSEPGVVWVMKDENQNGLPDDTWYEIAGSNHFFSGTIKNYQVTYFRSYDRNIPWRDNRGASGVLPANEFNLQPYYPMLQYFPAYPQDSVVFHGTLLQNFYVTSGSGEIKTVAPVFGYADSRARVSGADLSLPDNPYTQEVEGAGGDPIDISWAVDSLGNYVDLDSIHFVKIVSANLSVAGWLGEISTDLAWVQPVNPVPGMNGKEILLICKPVPHKVLVGDSLQLEGGYFNKGRLTDVPVSIQSMDEKVAEVSSSGLLVAKSAGEMQVRYSANSETEFVSLKIAEPLSVKILNDFSAVYPGDTLELKAEVLDNWQEKLSLEPVYSTSGSATGKVIQKNGRLYFVALLPGEVILTAALDDFKLEQQLTVRVLSPNDKMKVFVSVKTAAENLLPLQWIEAGMTDLNALVENRNNDYNQSQKLSLAHAIAAGFGKAAASFKFRDDAAAEGKLYLYKVEYDGLFSYGWGGKVNPQSNARAWVVRHNNIQYLNSFDSVPIADGDTVIVYHVPDVLNSWQFTRLLPLDVGDVESQFLLERTSCALSDGNISDSGFTPVAGAAVLAGTSYHTGADGKVVVEYTDLPLVVSSGNDAVLLTEALTTGAGVTSLIFDVFPNPVERNLYVNSNSAGFHNNLGSKIKLFDINGSLLLEEHFFSGPITLDLSFLPPGIYHLVLDDGNRLETKKIIKR